MATTKYVAGVLPTFFSPCNTLDAVNTTPPEPTGSGLPSFRNSSFPSRIKRISEFLCRWGGCGILPAGSVVSWTSIYSPVTRNPETTFRMVPPFGSSVMGRRSYEKVLDWDSTFLRRGSPAFSDFPAKPMPLNTARADIARQASRRFIAAMRFFSEFSVVRPTAPTNLSSVPSNCDHKVPCGAIAHIPCDMPGSKRNEDHPTLGDLFRSPVVLKKQCSLLHQNELRVLNRMRRIRSDVGRLQGLVQRNHFTRCQLAVKDVPAFSSIRVGRHGQPLRKQYLRLGERHFSRRLRLKLRPGLACHRPYPPAEADKATCASRRLTGFMATNPTPASAFLPISSASEKSGIRPDVSKRTRQGRSRSR